MDLSGTEIKSVADRIIANIEKVIVGKRKTLELTIIGLFCQGHILIEDVPGVGKTVLARSLAASLGLTFNRIQFTPDMLPSDITGVSIFNQVSKKFEFRPGPIMSQIVLGDEINRATPKTQSALLEAMEERQITVDGLTHPLPKPFLVMATQNPIEYEGTFPLPEAQLDRFFMKISIGYPSINDEINILEMQQLNHPITTLKSVIDHEELGAIQEMVKRVYVSAPVKRYIVDLIRATRSNKDLYLGSSPRGSLNLFKGAQAKAAIEGRDFVLPDDIKMLAPSLLSHRIIVSPATRLNDVEPIQVIEEILNSLPIPVGSFQ
ncbi:MAG: AAA family ATPase [Anaerolineaceae bacterium]